MTPCSYTAKDGTTKTCDLDSVVDVFAGYSKVRADWTALIILASPGNVFIELRSSPPDYRGNSADEAQEIDEDYIRETFGLSAAQLGAVKTSPRAWQFIDHRRAS